MYLDDTEDFPGGGGWGIIDRGGPLEQYFRYERVLSNELRDITLATERYGLQDYKGLFAEPITDDPCQPSDPPDCSAWLVEEAPGPPPAPESALAELQAYDVPDLRAPDEVDYMTLSVAAHAILVDEGLSYYLFEAAVGTNSLAQPKGVFTTYEVDPDVSVWRPLTGFDGSPDDSGLVYTDVDFPELVRSCQVIDPFGARDKVCVPESMAVSVEWIGFAGVPEGIDRLEYLAADGAWRALVADDVAEAGLVPMPSDMADPVQIRLGEV